MPATVLVSEPVRTGLRAVLVIAAAVVLLIPLAVSVAYGTSRLNYTRVETSETLPASTRDLQFTVDTGASISVRSADAPAPTVTLTGVGPRDEVPTLQIDTADGQSVISVEDQNSFENAALEVTVPAAASKDTNLGFDTGFGAIDVAGEYNEVTAETSAGAIALDGTFARVQATTDWGQTDLSGTFGTVEMKSGAGALEGSDLRVRERIDATTSMGSIDLDFSNDMAPTSGISAKTDDGAIDLRLPRLDLVQANIAAEANGSGAAPEDVGQDFIYRINANANQGSVELAKDLEQYDAAKNSPDAEGKTVIPVSATADTGAVTIDQN